MNAETPETPNGLPPHLRRLGQLVTVLTLVMICGVVVLIAAVVIRLNAAPPPSLPEAIALPEGTAAQAVTFGADWYAVVTTDDQILVFDRDTGALRQEIAISPGE